MSQEISKININGNTYDVKDAKARENIKSLDSKVDTKVTDEANGTVTNPLDFINGLKINGAIITAEGNTVTFE